MDYGVLDQVSIYCYLLHTLLSWYHDTWFSHTFLCLEILESAGMTKCKPCSTPVDIHPKLSITASSHIEDPTNFRSLVVVLTFTRPGIYLVQQVCLHMHDPRSPHLAALKHIMRYLRGTLDLCLFLHPMSQSDLVAYSYADWKGCPNTCKSTLGLCSLPLWQPHILVVDASVEAEYHNVANVVAETTWMWQLLLELHILLRRVMLVYYDNISVAYMFSNLVPHQYTKHIEIALANVWLLAISCYIGSIFPIVCRHFHQRVATFCVTEFKTFSTSEEQMFWAWGYGTRHALDLGPRYSRQVMCLGSKSSMCCRLTCIW